MKGLQTAKRTLVFAPGAATTATAAYVLDTTGASNVAVTLILSALANTSTGTAPTLQFSSSNDATADFVTFASAANRTLTGRVAKVSLTLFSRRTLVNRYLRVLVTPGVTVATDAVSYAGVAELDPEIRVADLDDLTTDVVSV